MARIPEQVIKDILHQVDIVEVVSQYIPLNRQGRNFVGLCPFHDDRNPSMSVSPEKQIFHCFVCNSGGNAFTFVQKYENVSYPESVKRVAEIANIPFDYQVSSAPNETNTKFKPLYDVLNDAIEFCAYELKSSAGTRFQAYIKKRGITEAISKKFSIGYNPSENKLYSFLKAKKHSDEDMIACNVVRLSERGVQDVFYNRLVIPIHDAYGNPVGFTARAIDDSAQAKYINTSQTPIYEKGDLLFNYHRARQDAKKLSQVILVEGAMDVIAFEKANVTNSVATLGTACTEKQIKLLKYLNATVLVFYDGDKAGQEATYKFAKQATEKGLHVEIVKNEHGLDPDEIIDKFGTDELVATSKKTISWIEFLFKYLQNKYNLENYSEKKEYAKVIGEEINKLEDQFERDNYYKRLYEISGFDLSKEATIPRVEKAKQEYSNPRIQKPKNGIKNAQVQILSLMLISKQAMELFRQELGFLPETNYNNLAVNIVNYYRNNDTIMIAELLDYLNEDEVKNILLEITNWELAPNDYDEQVMKEAISKIRDGLISQQIHALIEQSNQLSDPIQKAKIADEVVKLRRKRGD